MEKLSVAGWNGDHETTREDRDMTRTICLVTVLAALGSAIVGGAMYAFSSFVMSGLDRATPSQAIAAMQGINLTAVRAPFMIPFIGTALLSVALVVAGLVRNGRPESWWLVAGGVVYLAGAFVLTIAYHVPRNDALATLDPNSADAAARWATYYREWTRANHVRAVTGLVAAGLFVTALVRA
jgi:uncharacterized membrane protein